MKRIVLAYSGGLETSVAIPWLAEHASSAEIVAVMLDVGRKAGARRSARARARARRRPLPRRRCARRVRPRLRAAGAAGGRVLRRSRRRCRRRSRGRSLPASSSTWRGWSTQRRSRTAAAAATIAPRSTCSCARPRSVARADRAGADVGHVAGARLARVRRGSRHSRARSAGRSAVRSPRTSGAVRLRSIRRRTHGSKSRRTSTR